MPTKTKTDARERSQRAILAALNAQAQQSGKHVYGGTVPPHVIARRRRRNKIAKLSRRANRGTC